VASHVEALLRRVLGAPAVDAILRALLVEALAASGAVGGVVYYWDAGAQRLLPVDGAPLGEVRLGEGAAGVASARRQSACEGEEVGIAVVRGEELLGALCLRGVSGDIAEVEQLAAVGAIAITWFEAVRLSGALLAARTAEHEVNNRLVATTAYAQLMLRDPTVPPHLRERAESIAKGAREAALIVRKLRELVDIQETRWGEDPDLTTIDLDRSRGRSD
jgi:hypothetical protein